MIQSAKLSDYITEIDLNALVAKVRREDMGPDYIDITSAAALNASHHFVSSDLLAMASATIRSRDAGILCGAALIPVIARLYDPGLLFEIEKQDGDALEPGSVVATFRGSLKSILSAERILLNFVNHLSGISTETFRYVKCISAIDSPTRVCDTRKTIPGLRALQKYAVACGGGVNHRIGLYDAVLIKDNHIAHIATEDLNAYITQLIHEAQSIQADINAQLENGQPQVLKFFEMEVDTLAQLEAVLPIQELSLVLLDNMSPDMLNEARHMRDQLNPRIKLEASGGVTLDTLEAIARTHVDRVSIGALTHSVRQLDLGMDIIR